MAKAIHSGRRKESAPGKARAGRSAHVMNPECLALLERHFDVLKKRVRQFKDSEEGRRIMCKAVEETAKRMLKDGILALKDIARYSGLSLAQVKELQASRL